MRCQPIPTRTSKCCDTLHKSIAADPFQKLSLVHGVARVVQQKEASGASMAGQIQLVGSQIIAGISNDACLRLRSVVSSGISLMGTPALFGPTSHHDPRSLQEEWNMKPIRMVQAIRRATLAACLFAIPMLGISQTKDSVAISDALHEARSHAAVVQDDAATLDSYTRSQMSWQSHARHLQRMKEHANDLMSDFNKLQGLKAEGSPWQQEAIDRIDPLLREMANHLNATIDHLNNNQSQVQMQPYRDYVDANLDVMTRARDAIADFVSYGEARSTADDLEQKLEMSSSASPSE